ncbi:hypothetical protein Lqui_2134 [Legionella quinlivanii]|uniref:Uncharacterized protein n=4 Tax=Legionella TaxID=445 RepID=A0A0W0XT91_9GAMM|nr:MULTISPECIES: hypothetical protein [Legionella]KTC71416.1 hypothetical protein Lbir_1754 [Legionella birminghamensis]KTD48061.1 hypothetical protein Lqui_2134 [Legionella quinlivanii]SEG48079.1 hypothetical protein SAMN02746093_03101 [Legionella quinlivanii DSM 21216]STX60983.1 Uncharacterised protein [Legionella birminghamensis]STY49856.1 Uncharacterised protein [Legionella quinlivanii]
MEWQIGETVYWLGQKQHTPDFGLFPLSIAIVKETIQDIRTHTPHQNPIVTARFAFGLDEVFKCKEDALNALKQQAMALLSNPTQRLSNFYRMQ